MKLLLFSLLLVVCARGQNNIITCASGFLPGHFEVITSDRINDGYCDCPLTGEDEPHTEACSGALVGGWAGIRIPKSTTTLEPLKITCPEQPSLVLPVSRIHDGICDCCCGFDEDSSLVKCPNTCHEVLKEERERRRLLEENFVKGHTKRKEELVNFENMVKKTMIELDSVTAEHSALTDLVSEVQDEIKISKRNALKQRRLLVEETIASSSELLQGLLEPLSDDELVTVIVQACQLAGEQDDAQDYYSTCVPLRLAGLDQGLVWETEDFQHGTVSLQRLDLESIVWADLMDRNAAGEVWWSNNDKNSERRHRHRRRRLAQEDWEEDESHYEEEEDWDEDDDYSREYDKDKDDDDAPVSSKAAEKNQELYDEITSFPFSATRVSFLKRASDILGKIDELTKETDVDEREEEGEENQESETPAIDPMALQMVQSTLRRREQSIQRGLDYAVSANILVKSVEKSRRDLIALAAGTLYHGKIRSTDVWQILAYMTVDLPKESCVSPWSILCPPQVTERNGTPYPPPFIVKAAEEFCQGADTKANICAESSAEDIPMSIQDNYYGYSTVQPRDDQDALSHVFAPLATDLGDRTTIIQLLEKKDDLEEKRKSLSNRMKELEEEMGGRDHSKYGSEGELYSLRDTCHSVHEGKYIYEVCIFGRATQKEEDGASLTQLGRWENIKIDPETGVRTMEWTKGTKCWNGPERSATVHLTCGAENKILWAEEPETCHYVLEMESYIACDDSFKQRHGL